MKSSGKHLLSDVDGVELESNVAAAAVDDGQGSVAGVVVLLLNLLKFSEAADVKPAVEKGCQQALAY